MARLCVRLSVLQEMTGNPHRLSQIFVKADSPQRIQEVLGNLRAQMRSNPIQGYQ